MIVTPPSSEHSDSVDNDPPNCEEGVHEKERKKRQEEAFEREKQRRVQKRREAYEERRRKHRQYCVHMFDIFRKEVVRHWMTAPRNELKRNAMEGNLSSRHEEDVSFIGPQAVRLVPPPTVSPDAINSLAREVESKRSVEIWIIRKLFLCYCKRNLPNLNFTLKLLFAYCLSQKLRLDPTYEVDSKWWYFFKKIIGSEDFSRAHYCVRRWLIQRGWLARNLNLHHFVIGMHTVPNTAMTNFSLNHPTSRDPTAVSPQPPYPFSSWEVYLNFHSQDHTPTSQPLPNVLRSTNDVSAATSTGCGAKLKSNKDHDDEEK